MNVVYIIILTLLSLQVVYTLTLSIAGLFFENKRLIKSDYKRKIAIFIPAYKEDKVILKTVKNVQKQIYQSGHEERFEIIVVAQHLKWYTLRSIRKMSCKYITYNVDNSTKIKALKHAIKELKNENKKYDIALILDADNHISKGFLEQLNTMFAYGNKVVQCHRTAKNTNTPIAVLDALSEEISNNILRKGCSALGLSSSIIGSGIAFTYPIFKKFINKSDAIAGFDKELTCELTKNRIKIAYLNTAIVYDEKVQDKNTFKKQRSRWIDAQINMAKKYFIPSLKSLIKNKNIDFFIKSIEHIFIPRLMFLALLILLSLITVVVGTTLMIPTLILTLLYIISLIISVPAELRTNNTIKALFKLPIILITTIKSFLNIKQSKKEFIHTPHNIN